MNRNEHLFWCKKRALEYVDKGELQEAFLSMTSDMSKHDQTKTHAALDTMRSMYFGRLLETPEEMRKFIEGFN